MTDLAHVIAQLRHAYSHLAAGRVTDQREFADGLLAPQIQRLEAIESARPKDDDALR